MSILFWYPFMILIACILATARIAGTTNPSFQAVAHVVVGVLIGVALGERKWRFAYIAIALSAVELATALITRLL